MKRLALPALALALLCALALPAAADVAYLPRDNFIENHWSDCRYENRWYWTNGAEGYVLAYKNPESREAAPLPNGRMYYISNVYKDKWGVLEYDPDTMENALGNNSFSGWVDMDEMVADYDNRSFTADHAAEIRDESAELSLDGKGVVYGYKYPGSGVVRDELDSRWTGSGAVLTLSPLFTDPAGRKWGYCNYFQGHRDFWICLDDPTNDALEPDENRVSFTARAAETPAPEPTAPPTETPTEAPSPAPTEAPSPAPTEAPTPTPAPAGKTVELTPPADDATLAQAAKDNRGSGPYLAAGAGGVVVVAAAVLAAALRKKRK